MIQDINGNIPGPHHPTRRTHPSPNSHNQAPVVVKAEANTSNMAIRDNSQEGGDVYVIAHDARVQKLMDKYELSWGVQYELARGVSDGRWTWENITESEVRKLCGSNQNSAGSVSAVMRGFAEAGTSTFGRNIWCVYFVYCSRISNHPFPPTPGSNLILNKQHSLIIIVADWACEGNSKDKVTGTAGRCNSGPP